LDAGVAREKFGLLDSMLVLRCGTVGFERSYTRDYRQIYGKAAQKKGPQNQNPHGQYNYFSTEFHPLYRCSDLHTMQSVTKTITSVTIEIAMTRGDFTVDLNTPAQKPIPPNIQLSLAVSDRKLL
jgi:CubicO group peptidase (beta-lactamase class C family)